MLKKIAFFGFLSAIMCLSACKPGYSPKVQKLHDEVMAIHDEVMPEMGTIHKLKKQLKAKLKEAGVTLNEDNINNSISALDYADEAMMDWMHQFKVPKNVDDAALLTYLEDQKVKISKVNTDMRTSIKNAQNALNE